MERINPTNFYGPRAYITDFDPNIIRFKSNKEAYKIEIERRLKVLLLTKKVVTCAGSHLSNQFTYEFFKSNQILLKENLIIPTLRIDKQHVTDYIGDRKIKKSLKVIMQHFYEDRINKVVNWEIAETTEPFKKILLQALKDERSVIRRNLYNLSNENLNYLLNEIETCKILTRKTILKGISSWPTKERKIFMNFLNLIYHMCGARAHNCESALPQESYIDYSLTDFSKHRTAFSDTQIFFKMFFELAFETLYKNAIPVELLDVLSFEDIYYLRKPIVKSSFCKKYDELIQMIVPVVQKSEIDSKDVVYDLEKTPEILGEISKTFEEIFKQELPEFLKRKSKETSRALLKSTTSLGIGAVGLVPVIGNIATALDLFQSSNEVFVNLNQTLESKKEINNYNLYLKNKERVLHQLIEKSPISEKSTLLDTLDLMVNTVSTRIKL